MPQAQAKIAIISAVFGNYDSIKQQRIENAKSVDWFLFTDAPPQHHVHPWKCITQPYHLEACPQTFNDIKDKRIFNMMSAKYYKAQTHNIPLLAPYDYYIWIDGSIFLRDNFINNVLETIQQSGPSDIISFKHSARNNILDEVKESVGMNKYRGIADKIVNQYNDYIGQGFKDDVGLFENTVMIKRNNPKSSTIFDMWWEHNVKYSYQDQISFPFVLWKTNTTPFLIHEYVFNNTRFSFITKETFNVSHHW